MKAWNELKQGLEEAWDSVSDGVSEGWRRLGESAAGAITRFRPSDKSSLPSRAEVDDTFYLPSARWGMLAGDVFEDDKRLVIRLEVPGMDKGDFDIEVRDRNLFVRGEKRFERETGEGRYRVLQCAYGAFQRVIPLPASVLADEAAASYRQGVLKIELPKAKSAQPRTIDVGIGD